MGCNSSTVSGKPIVAGNLLVDGFLRYVHMASQGWSRVKPESGRKELHLEVYSTEEPLGTWRGFVVLDGVSLEDVLSFVKYKLGADNYELLENDEEEYIFRELFDFKDSEGENKFAGDHRGETAERMEGGGLIQDPRRTNLASLKIDKSQPAPLTNVVEEETNQENAPSTTAQIAQNGDSGSEDEEEDNDVENTKKPNPSIDVEPVQSLENLLDDSSSRSSRFSTWQSRLFPRPSVSNREKSNGAG